MNETRFSMATNLPNGVTLLTSNEEFDDQYRHEFWDMHMMRSAILGVSTSEQTAMLTHNALVKFASAVTGGE